MAWNNRSGGQGRQQERNGPDDSILQEALAAHAKGAVDVILALATQRNVKWDDALYAYPAAFERAAHDTLDRITRSREGRR